MFKTRLSGAIVGFLCAATCLAAEPATTPSSRPTKTTFLRWTGDATSGKLEAAIVTYRNKATGARVDLVSAIHVADRSYYATLDKLFQSYDAVLYEMVKPADAEMPAPGEPREDSAVSSIQRFIQNGLGLEFQLDRINYRAKNFVHADLDVDAFQQMQEERGESIFLLMLQMMMEELLDPQGGAGAKNSRLANMTLPELLAILTSPDRPRQLKLLLGPEFGDIDGQFAALEGLDGSVLLTERNKAAIKVLKDSLSKGKKNLAIFYGAAHLRDLEKRLAEMNFHPTNTQWITAWDVTPKPATTPATRTTAPRTSPTERSEGPLPR